MNKQLVELAEQAGFLNNYNVPEDGFEVFFVDEKHTTKCLAKFAELIVKECISGFKERISTRYQGSDKDRDIAYGMEIVYDDIVNKFGVEE